MNRMNVPKTGGNEPIELERSAAETKRDKFNSPAIVDGLMLVGKPGLKLADAFTWRKWSMMRIACLWEAVALHCYLDPVHMTKASIGYYDNLPSGSAARFYQERISIAVQHLCDGALKSRDEPGLDLNLRSVRLSDYAQWARDLGMTLPPYFPTTPTSKLTTPDMWPWGTHDTVMLGHLVAAANHFWKPVSEGGNYDPERPITAKSNKEVAAWLFKRTNSANISMAMATILRADNLPPGPRTAHKK